MERRESGARVCPFCEARGLRPRGLLARCDSCGRVVEADVLETMDEIAALPDAIGGHACECGHPEMRRLPDGVYHCPACGSEVTPAATVSGLERGARND
ncbi:hypothetical protein [Rubrobacter tropicus]|uniref:hypothetical protein n=1 Tax=Rubrobacter tropicus TaxID=2653851 RepID=UPI00140B22E9|nr:hypothetical protein [Rubrobacter tropicus]